MGRRHAISLVARRELGERMRRRSYFVVSALLVLIVVGIGVGFRLFGDQGVTTTRFAVTGSQAGPVVAALRTVPTDSKRAVQASTAPNATSARSLMDEHGFDAVVDTDRHKVLFSDAVDPAALAVAQQAWSATQLRRNLRGAGLDSKQITGALDVQQLSGATVQSGGGVSGAAVISGTLAAVLLFLSLQTFGGQILTGVVEEKSSAVIEVLLARLRPDELLAGKVLGIGIAALAQFTLVVAAGLVALTISGRRIPPEIWAAVPMTLVWFLGGFGLYAMLFALAGSLVSRQEDAQSAAVPVMIALGGGYVLVFLVGYTPGSAASRVLSVLPPVAPLLMPMRMAAGEASSFEVILALVLLGLAIIGAWKFTARVYSQVLLRRGARISWSDAWTIARERGL